MLDGKNDIAIIPAQSPDNKVDIVSFFKSDVLSFFRLSNINMEDASGAVKAADIPATAPAAII